MILDGVLDHIASHVATLSTTKEMWDAVGKLYENPLENRKIILKEKLRTTKMYKGESISSYMTRI